MAANCHYIALISISLAFLIPLTILEGANAEFVCKDAGKFPHENPTKYYQCSSVGDKFTQLVQDCPPDNCFDVPKATCQVEECIRTEEDSNVSGKPPAAFKCTATGKYPHEDPAQKGAYYKCEVAPDGKFYVFQYQCLPTIPCFDAKSQKCKAC